MKTLALALFVLVLSFGGLTHAATCECTTGSGQFIGEIELRNFSTSDVAYVCKSSFASMETPYVQAGYCDGSRCECLNGGGELLGRVIMDAPASSQVQRGCQQVFGNINTPYVAAGQCR